MEQQGLPCATGLVQMSKEDKLGMDPQLMRIMTRGVMKEGILWNTWVSAKLQVWGA
jgi:transketolase N-terminal domain/subunit